MVDRVVYLQEKNLYYPIYRLLPIVYMAQIIKNYKNVMKRLN
jgi:hypothetical protein